MNDKSISLAVILGDGVGHDVLPVATEVIQAAAGAVGVAVEPEIYDYGALHYLEHGTPCRTTWKDWCGASRTGTTPSSSEVLVSTPGFRRT